MYGYGVTFNEIHSSNLELVMKSINRQALAAVDDVYQYIPGKDGSYLYTGGLTDRFITVKFSVSKDNLPDLRQQIRKIAAWLQTKERTKLIFDDEPDKYYMAKVHGALDLDQIVTIGEFIVTFRCEPYAISISEKVYILGEPVFLSPTLVAYTNTVNVSNNGTTDLYPVFKATFIDAATELKISCGVDYVRVVKNFNPGDVLIIDNALNEITINDVNAMAYYDWQNSNFYTLSVGESSISILPQQVAQVELTIKERWL